jgi:tetratricopeptide (TPR) repeat protein
LVVAIVAIVTVAVAHIVAEVAMSPKGSLLERTQVAILSSFSRDELRQTVQFVTGRPLDVITPDKTLEVQVFDLLTWTFRTGCTLELVRGLQQIRPQNQELAAVAAALEAVSADPAVAADPATAHTPLQSAARPAGATSPRRIPLHKPLRTQHFIGRTAELARLLAALQPGRTVTLCGPGGIGKTTLAAEAIWMLAPGNEAPERFPDGIFFHTFYRQPQAGLALTAIARAYGVDPRPTPRDAAHQALAGRQALIVLDGAEAADDLEAVLAVTGTCGVIITTRRHADAPADYHDLEPLPRAESLDLLCAWAGPYAVDGNDGQGGESPDGFAAANEMVRLLGGLPLALFLAGRYLAQRRQQACEFVAWLEQTGLDALHFADRPSKSIPLLMARSLEQVSDAAQAAFGVVGVLALAPFDAEVVAAGLDITAASAHQALGELVDYGLVLRPDDAYQVTHALAHAYARAHTAPCSEAIARLAHYYSALAQAQSGFGPTGFAVLDPQRPHMVAVQAAALKAGQWDAVRRLTWKLKDYLDLKGYMIIRLIIVQAGLDAARAAGDRYDEGQFLNELGLVHYSLGEHRRAVDMYVLALAIAREIGDREGEGNALGNLGLAYATMGETRRAIELYEQALALDRAIGDRRGEGADLGNLGLAYYSLGETRRAIELHAQRLGIAREIEDRRGEAIALGNLGNAYAALGETRRAIELYEQHLVITREIGDRQGEAIGNWNLGEAYEMEGDLARAIACMEVCVAYEEEIHHPDAGVDGARVEKLKALWQG